MYNSAACSLAITNLTGLDLLAYIATLSRALTHFLEGQGPPIKVLGVGALASLASMVPSVCALEFSFAKLMKLTEYVKSKFIF